MEPQNEHARELADRINAGIDYVSDPENALRPYQLGIGPRDAVLLTQDARFFAWLAATPHGALESVFDLANRSIERFPDAAERGRFKAEAVEHRWSVEVAITRRQPKVVL